MRRAMPTSDLLAMPHPDEPPLSPSHSHPVAGEGREGVPGGGQRYLPGLARRSNGLGRDPRESLLNRMMRALFGWSPTSIRSDLKVLLEGEAAAETGFSPDESRMLKNILGLRERRLDDLMVPRGDIVAVQQDIPLGELFKVFENASHSRLVVYNDTLDEPVGMVHIRDLIAFMTARAAVPQEAGALTGAPTGAPPSPHDAAAAGAGLNLAAVDLTMPLSATRIIRTILFVPPSMPAIDLLAKMQATHTHLALVIDEYGGTDGLASIEDIVEEIVGDIEDEHDEAAERAVVRQPDGSYVAAGRASLDETVAVIGGEFDVGDAAEEVDTVGGLIVTRIGRVPVRGELVPGPGPFEIEILDADPRRVKRVRIYRRKPASRTAERSAARRPETATRTAAKDPVDHPVDYHPDDHHPVDPSADKDAVDKDEAASFPGAAEYDSPHAKSHQ
jgi:CBS domain containing-hemolysin-like protein